MTGECSQTKPSLARIIWSPQTKYPTQLLYNVSSLVLLPLMINLMCVFKTAQSSGWVSVGTGFEFTSWRNIAEPFLTVAEGNPVASTASLMHKLQQDNYLKPTQPEQGTWAGPEQSEGQRTLQLPTSVVGHPEWNCCLCWSVFISAIIGTSWNQTWEVAQLLRHTAGRGSCWKVCSFDCTKTWGCVALATELLLFKLIVW